MAEHHSHRQTSPGSHLKTVPDLDILQRVHANWPAAGTDRQSQARRSGIACAVIVFRHVLAHFSLEDRYECLDGAAADRHGGVGTAAMSSDLLEAAVQLDPLASSVLCNEIERAHDLSELSFERLTSSDQMRRAVWETPYFRFFNDGFFRKSKNHPWRRLPPDASLPTEEEFLCWDGLSGTGLAGYLDHYSHIIEDVTTGFQLKRIGNAPMVLRLRFCNKKASLNLYRDLFCLDLRIHPSSPDEPVMFPYRCVAVVRLRDSAEDADTLRLYDMDANVYRLGHEELPWSSQWRVSDGATYVLFYVRIDAVPIKGQPLTERQENDDAEDVSIAEASATAVLSQTLARLGGDVLLASKPDACPPPSPLGGRPLGNASLPAQPCPAKEKSPVGTGNAVDNVQTGTPWTSAAISALEARLSRMCAENIGQPGASVVPPQGAVSRSGQSVPTPLAQVPTPRISASGPKSPGQSKTVPQLADAAKEPLAEDCSGSDALSASEDDVGAAEEAGQRSRRATSGRTGRAGKKVKRGRKAARTGRAASSAQPPGPSHPLRFPRGPSGRTDENRGRSSHADTQGSGPILTDANAIPLGRRELGRRHRESRSASPTRDGSWGSIRSPSRGQHR